VGAWHWPQSRIHNVVDGDTVDSTLIKLVDIGFNITNTVALPMRLRLARINAARSSSAKGKRAKELVIARTSNVDLLITTLKSYKYGGPEEKMAEYMAEVTLPDGANLSDLLVSLGLATYWDGSGPRPDDA
jgi:endonuclease YncB( thermonuclease family)